MRFCPKLQARISKAAIVTLGDKLHLKRKYPIKLGLPKRGIKWGKIHCRKHEARKHVLTCRLSLGAHWDQTAIFIKNILCGYCLHDSGLYIQKILTKREIINCQKFNLLLFLTLNSVTTGVRELNGTSQISLVTHDAKG